MTAPNEATARQIEAARPNVSTWVAANAGSGKTRVLTDRVARLLLQGVAPERILCLTYTKAAASEMQNRLFKRLGDWAMKPSAELKSELIELGLDHDAADLDLKKARRLFARAIEAPGGLKIQTIHSFCASILRRFPLEAQVAPQFTEIEDRAAKLLQEEIVDAMAMGPDRDVVDAISRHLSDQTFEKVTGALIKNKALFQQKVDLDDVFGLPKGFDESALFDRIFLGSERHLLDAIVPILLTSSSNDQKAARKLNTVRTFNINTLGILEDVFVYQHGTKTNPNGPKLDRFPTAAGRELIADHIDPLQSFMTRVADAKPFRLGLLAKRRTIALQNFAQLFLPEYARQKELRGWLDFDDQIEKTRDLLRDRSLAQWVLFRLDGGIDHILVDEAQDTSPDQWDVIESLTQEMTSGEGARKNTERTIFVVGDPKQSIYSFQGADPSGFGRMRAKFKQALKSIDKPFGDIQLLHSFRSSAAILETVDKVFETGGQKALDGVVAHKTFKSDLPGRVDVFAPEVQQAKDDKLPWYSPLDRTSPADAKVELANRIADRIKHMIDTETPIPDERKDGTPIMRPVHEGDFLILVRSRKHLFPEIIRACKARKLKIAGADRLKIGGETAVADLTALLSFLVTPEDDLSLACILKSPLFGWSEQQLFDLAHRRPDNSYLWRALQSRQDEFAHVVSVLEDLRNNADFLRPYDLLERALTRHGGRQALIARLGAQAEDGIDALLDQAQAYETTDIPNLTGFLTWLQVEEVEIKRQNDGSKDEIRVMTIHGAKGLESPIVLLPECGKKRKPGQVPVVLDVDGIGIWPPTANHMPDIVRTAKDGTGLIQDEESERLFYVAMTRAEKWLMIDSITDKTMKVEGSWYARALSAITDLGATETKLGAEQATRFEKGRWDKPLEKMPPDPNKKIQFPEDLLHRPAPAAPRLITVAPSKLGGAKVISAIGNGADEDTALKRGRLIHLLLEHLPDIDQSDWESHSTFLLTQGEDFAEGQEAIDIKKAAFGVLQADHLAFLFDQNALAEVDISAPLPQLDNARMHGGIDRLLEFEDHILAVDFKSNDTVPETAHDIPEGLLRQMGAYVEGLQQIFPHKPVKAALLWTKTASLMEVPHKMVMDALSRATLS